MVISEDEKEDESTDAESEGHQHNHSEHHKEMNLNIRAAAVHIIGDIVQSIGVIIAALIIFLKPEWQIIDPICTFLFSVLVIFTTVPVSKDCLKVLMEASPHHIEARNIIKELLKLRGVKSVHDLHVWSLSKGKLSLSAHIISDNPLLALKCATEYIKEKYRISHTTIQVEAQSHLEHSFTCSHDLHD